MTKGSTNSSMLYVTLWLDHIDEATRLIKQPPSLHDMAYCTCRGCIPVAYADPLIIWAVSQGFLLKSVRRLLKAALR